MTDAQYPESLDPASKNQQEIQGNNNQVIAQVLGGMVVYGTVIYNNASAALDGADAKPTRSDIGPNPYKGLLAFQETDGDRFFGREKQIQELWERFRRLHKDESAVRLLPIYGPSGSGKSSLARAGLIPALAKRPLPGRDRARVAVLFPTSHPLEALATVLAQIATNEQYPAEEIFDKFKGYLTSKNTDSEYHGLRRIADMMPNIDVSPLIVLVDQLEEVYTLCKDEAERDAFMGNLLCAASERSNRVSAIVTLRSDFLGATQKHPQLNQLIAAQGSFVSAMSVEGLRDAIRKPAERAGQALDESTMSLLVAQTEGREGALPLLQFALTRIWEGIVEGKKPALMLMEIGGVGGALAGEAQRTYKSLNADEQEIAQRVFLGLVQLGEGAKDTRRRVDLQQVTSYRDSPEQVKRVIARFADPGMRLITLASNGADSEMAEVTHEALFEHWVQLKAWLDVSRSDLRFQRRLEEDAKEWKKQKNKAKDFLLRGARLKSAEEFRQIYKEGRFHSRLAEEFIQASQRRYKIHLFLTFSPLVSSILAIVFSGWKITQSEIQSEIKITDKLLELRISEGEKILDNSRYCSLKKEGVRAFSASINKKNNTNFFDAKTLKIAIMRFKETLIKNKICENFANDPETLIYKNNAEIYMKYIDKDLHDFVYKVVVSVPIGSNPGSAQDILQGVSEVQDKINHSAKAINGKQLLVEIANDDNNPVIAKKLAEKFVQDSHVIAVIGHNVSPVSIAAAPIYEQGKLVMISPSSSETKLTILGKEISGTRHYEYIFRTIAKANVLADYLVKNVGFLNKSKTLKSKFFVCSDNDAPAKPDYIKSFKSKYLLVNVSEKLKKDQTEDCELSSFSFDPKKVVKLAEEKQVEGFLLIANSDRILNALEVAKEVSKTNRIRKNRKERELILLGNAAMDKRETLDSGREDVNGLVLVTPWFTDESRKDICSSSQLVNERKSLNWLTAMSYDATLVLTEALKQRKSTTRTELKDILHNLSSPIRGRTGKIQFDEYGDRKKAEDLMKLVQVQRCKKPSNSYKFVLFKKPL